MPRTNCASPAFFQAPVCFCEHAGHLPGTMDCYLCSPPSHPQKIRRLYCTGTTAAQRMISRPSMHATPQCQGDCTSPARDVPARKLLLFLRNLNQSPPSHLDPARSAVSAPGTAFPSRRPGTRRPSILYPLSLPRRPLPATKPDRTRGPTGSAPGTPRDCALHLYANIKFMLPPRCTAACPGGLRRISGALMRRYRLRGAYPKFLPYSPVRPFPHARPFATSPVYPGRSGAETRQNQKITN